MATTTTNFGWDIPQSTDLVKDGATAIATLGQDIDTAFVDLKGGTTGQVLSKASGTDLDFTWVAQDDSNAIQNAIVDAKGDLIAATAADTPARLAVGTNGQVLTADSTAATGLAWAAPGGGSLVYVGGASPSSVSSQTVDNVFSTTYENYMVVLSLNFSSSTNCYLRLRSGGTDDTASDYYSRAKYDQINGGANGAFALSASSYAGLNDALEAMGVYYFIKPKPAVPTFISGTKNGFKFSTDFYQGDFSAIKNSNTAYDGFKLYLSSGTFSGNIRVYGIANS